METQFWRQFTIGFIVINTVCVFILFEFFLWGRPYVSGFLGLFVLLFFLNRKLLVRTK